MIQKNLDSLLSYSEVASKCVVPLDVKNVAKLLGLVAVNILKKLYLDLAKINSVSAIKIYLVGFPKINGNY